MAAKMHPKGTKLEVDTAGGTTWVAVADLAGLMPPPKARRPAKSTHFESANDYDEFIPGWKDGGEPTVRLRFHKTQFATLDTAFESDAIPNWRISFPSLSGETTPSRWTFLAIIVSLSQPERSVDDDEVYEAEMTLRITGKPTFVAGV